MVKDVIIHKKETLAHAPYPLIFRKNCIAARISSSVVGGSRGNKGMAQLRAIWCWLSPGDSSRSTPFNLRMVSLFCGALGCSTSFLVTTPETSVPALGEANHGFPYLRGTGRLAES